MIRGTPWVDLPSSSPMAFPCEPVAAEQEDPPTDEEDYSMDEPDRAADTAPASSSSPLLPAPSCMAAFCAMRTDLNLCNRCYEQVCPLHRTAGKCILCHRGRKRRIQQHKRDSAGAIRDWYQRPLSPRPTSRLRFKEVVTVKPFDKDAPLVPPDSAPIPLPARTRKGVLRAARTADASAAPLAMPTGSSSSSSRTEAASTVPAAFAEAVPMYQWNVDPTDSVFADTVHSVVEAEDEEEKSYEREAKRAKHDTLGWIGTFESTLAWATPSFP